MAFPRLRVLTRRVLFAVTLSLVGLAAFFGWAVYQSGAELRAAMAEAAEDDPHWRLEDMLKQADSAAETETVASLVERLAPTIYAEGRHLPYGSLLLFGPDGPQRKRTADLRRVVDENRNLIEQLRRMSYLPIGRFQINSSDPAANYFSTVALHAYRVPSFLELSAIVNCQSGRIDEAVNDLIATFRFSRALSTIPSESAIDYRTLAEVSGVQLAEVLVSWPTITDQSLVTIGRIAAELELDRVAEQAYRGERAVLFAAYEKARWSGNSRMLLAGGGSVGRWEQLLATELRKEQLSVLLAFNRHVAVTRLPPEFRTNAASELNSQVLPRPMSKFSMVPLKCHPIELDVRRIAMLRCLRAIVGAKRYSLRAGQWPNSLTEVVAAGYLNDVPIDPFTGKQLEWWVAINYLMDKYPGFDRKSIEQLPMEVGAVAHVRFGKDGDHPRIAMPEYCTMGGPIGVRLFNPNPRPNR
ncbi:MAG: hypothetical protein K1X57_10085 [Gemmataceae bacterium]|nr:hypothetical protein [Gemmataceae bacterium]